MYVDVVAVKSLRISVLSCLETVMRAPLTVFYWLHKVNVSELLSRVSRRLTRLHSVAGGSLSLMSSEFDSPPLKMNGNLSLSVAGGVNGALAR